MILMGVRRVDEGRLKTSLISHPKAVRAELVASFNDYHSHIARQVALVDELIAAVAREEGEKSGHTGP